MSTNQQTAGWDVDVPHGWTIVDPPAGIALLAFEPEQDGATFRSNLVVTHQPRTGGPDADVAGEPSVERVNGYVDELLDALEANLPEAIVMGVWTAGRSDTTPERLATQRVLLGYRTPDGAEVEMLQQHVWLDTEIVTVTATVPADVDDVMIDTLNACLESVTPAR